MSGPTPNPYTDPKSPTSAATMKAIKSGSDLPLESYYYKRMDSEQQELAEMEASRKIQLPEEQKVYVGEHPIKQQGADVISQPAINKEPVHIGEQPNIEEKPYISGQPINEEKPNITEQPLQERGPTILKAEGAGEIGWSMVKGGGTIGGRQYSEHALERMAPNTLEVRAELTTRAYEKAAEKGFQQGTKEHAEFVTKYVDPRGITPSEVEDAIKNTHAQAGRYDGTFMHQNDNVTVITSANGSVITVIPK
ncbi:hypothetical protein [Paenibacillus piri]|uniref:Uncharacterized protein n=1 Tax=Paenibacillus piri TaxID=2547395 RepID=A0A4R5KFQ4_9BACL|nr:hypothetical protein [Paenibacillus piri]TDF94143.1 hypothetical protein E1757_24960 [Paenibacillus piri]